MTDFWIMQTEEPFRRQPFHRKNSGINHLAFRVENKGTVDMFHHDFLQANDIPTLYDTPKAFPEYHKGYYAVFFEDPDRMKLEVAYVPQS